MSDQELKDDFAKAAMQAILGLDKDHLDIDVNWANSNNNFGRIAKASYLIADAMMKHRETAHLPKEN